MTLQDLMMSVALRAFVLFLFQYLNGFGLGTWVTRNVDAGRWAAAFFLVLTNSATTAQAASATAAISVASHAIAPIAG